MRFFNQGAMLLSKTFLIFFSIGFYQTSQAQEYVWASNFPVGSSVVEISAQDQNGKLRSFGDLVGEKGLLFMLSRSFEW
ncbi:MAG: hypothetical protein CMQ41_11035 [Gammaproteobacteria bacterium]|nr:hypothetical protein [Gammaproteobacteria bacterium]|tara:strand:+ start:2699 stop:2935 length:237 start_codon:yes stop_codon:yes gene_type:complete